MLHMFFLVMSVLIPFSEMFFHLGRGWTKASIFRRSITGHVFELQSVDIDSSYIMPIGKVYTDIRNLLFN
jgi:hypothetical protein